MQQLQRGVLIAIEGIDGSGKSTLTTNLAKKLIEHKLPVIVTKEPGGTQLGQQLRTILQQQLMPVCAKAEYLLFATDRAQHMHELAPLLEQKNIILSDRMGDSSIVYQGYGHGLEIEMIKKINVWALNNHLPDITLFVSIDADTARARLKQRGKKLTTFEKRDHHYMQRIIKGFDIVMGDRTDVIKLDGNQSASALAQQAFDELMEWMKKNKIH